VRHLRGFAILEVLVALLVLSVGVLALVTTAGLVTRLMGEGRRAAVAGSLVEERLEILQAAGCGAPASGAEARDGVAIAWRLDTPPFPWARLVTVTLERVTPRGSRVDSLATVLLCR
jgi:type II secretory pathway pseudopilin PulG